MWLLSSPSGTPSPPGTPSPHGTPSPPGLSSPPNLQVHDLAGTLSSLEDDTAHLENNLYTLRYDLQDLNEGAYGTELIQSRALHVLGELKNSGVKIEGLYIRLRCLSNTVDTLETEGVDNELRKQYVVIDKSLAAADQMRKEMKSWGDTIYFEAYSLEVTNREGPKAEEHVCVI